MSRIRKLYYFDKKNMQEMISFLNNRDAFIASIMFNPFLPLHHLLPLKFKFLPESYVLKEKKEIKGLITIAPSKSPVKRLEILRLFFEENSYEDACELIQYAVSKYKALGAISFIVRVEDSLPDLLRCFVAKCGFSQISYERLWRINVPESLVYDKNMFREFRNADAPVVLSLYNEALLPHFRPLLSSDVKEFKEPAFRGLSYFSEYKYVLEDKKSKNILAYLSIKTSDNQNYIFDVIQSCWVEVDVNSILNFGIKQVQKRQKNFNIFVKTKKYTQFGEKYEQLFLEHKFECVQNQIVLTNSSAKIIKEKIRSGKFTILNQFCDGSINVPG